MPGRPDRVATPVTSTADADSDRLVLAAKAGHEWAIVVLFHDHQPLLLRYLRANDAAAAEDLAAEVWLAVAAKLVAFDGGRSAFRAWLFTIAHRRLVDHRRRLWRHRTDPVANERFADQPALDDPAELVVAHVSAQAAIDELVASLTPDQAEVVLLRVVGGLDAAEVADAMGRSANWVRVTQHRALRHLATVSGGLVTQ